jgi:hypothetical protein
MHLIIDLARDLAIVATELVVLIFLACYYGGTLHEFKGQRAATSAKKPFHPAFRLKEVKSLAPSAPNAEAKAEYVVRYTARYSFQALTRRSSDNEKHPCKTDSICDFAGRIGHIGGHGTEL